MLMHKKVFLVDNALVHMRKSMIYIINKTTINNLKLLKVRKLGKFRESELHEFH